MKDSELHRSHRTRARIFGVLMAISLIFACGLLSTNAALASTTVTAPSGGAFEVAPLLWSVAARHGPRDSREVLNAQRLEGARVRHILGAAGGRRSERQPCGV
jgi:predicted tellurium resistance membrane protein TerC